MDKLTFKEWSILADLETIAPLGEDFEFSMARGELKTAQAAITRLMTKLKGEGDLEAWVQSKITKAAEYLDTVADHLSHGEDDTERKKEVKEAFKSYKSVEEIAKKHKVSEEDIEKQLEMGMKVEKEHTTDSQVAKEIALQHLDELPNYYSKLKKVEKVKEEWSDKYKKSIDCDNPKGFSQRAHCQGRKKKIEEMISTSSVTGRKYRDISSTEDQRELDKERSEKEGEKRQTAKKRKEELTAERLTKGIRFYDKKGSGYIKDGKKVYDESYEVQEGNKSGDSSLRDWFTKSRASDGTPGWVQLGGKYAGKPCAKQPGQTTKPKCGSSKMKAALSDKEEESAFRRKNQEDPNPDKKGKAKNVATEEKDHEVSMAHKQLNKTIANAKQLKKDLGKKEKNIPAWVQAKITDTDHNMDAASGYLAKEAAGEKDACYSKVKSRYSVWPSAYASGALVKCRKVGAKNWGNKTKKEGYEFSNWRDEFKATEYESFNIVEPTPLKESEEIRYCPKCKKNEKKKECKYGEKYWTMFSLPPSLGGGGAYDPNEVHPANEGLSFEIGGGHKKAQKMGKIRNLSKGATGGEKDAAQAALKRLGGGVSLPLADSVIYPGQLKTEDYQKLQSTGNVFSIMLMWRGKTYRLQLFFSGSKRPSREEVKAEIQKFYPGGVLTHYYPSPSDPTQPIVVIQR